MLKTKGFWLLSFFVWFLLLGGQCIGGMMGERPTPDNQGMKWSLADTEMKLWIGLSILMIVVSVVGILKCPNPSVSA